MACLLLHSFAKLWYSTAEISGIDSVFNDNSVNGFS